MRTSDYHPALYSSALAIGLLPDEARGFLEICDHRRTHANYDELRAGSAYLAQNYDHVDFDPSYAIASDGRSPIGVTTNSGSSNEGGTVYEEGPQHPIERTGSDTVAANDELHAHFPDIMARWGCKKRKSTTHIDPVGMFLQGGKPGPDVVAYATTGWRGAWKDQTPWNYETETYHDIGPENSASTRLIHEASHFFGSPHGAQFSSYALISRENEQLAAALSTILATSGLAVNADEPETAGTQIYAPGVFAINNKAHLDEHLAEPDEYEELEPENVGTNALDHVGPALMVIPEVACWESAAGDELTRFTRRQALGVRATMMELAVERIDHALERIDDWLEDRLGQNDLEVRRLYDAATWYSEHAEGYARAHRKRADTEDEQRAARVLTRAQFAQTLGVFATESLLYVGNAYRLAVMASNATQAGFLLSHIHRGAELIGPTRNIPLAQQVAVQGLLLLASMRFSLEQ